MEILNDENLKYLLSKTAKILPDNPSEQGWSANRIKKTYYEGFIVLFNWLKANQETIDKSIKSNDENFAKLMLDLKNIHNGDEVVGKAKQDKNGNDIVNTYLIKSVYEEFVSAIENGTQWVKSFIKENGEMDNIYQIDESVKKILNGTSIVAKAKQDKNGDDISLTYIPKNKIASNKNSADTAQLTTLAIVRELINDLSNSLVNGSIESLDTLKELANALGNDENFSATITELIGKKLSIDEAANTYLKKNEAEENLTKKTETAALNERLDNFIDKWDDVPKIATLGSGRYKIQYEEWIGDLGKGRYSMILNI